MEFSEASRVENESNKLDTLIERWAWEKGTVKESNLTKWDNKIWKDRVVSIMNKNNNTRSKADTMLSNLFNTSP